VLVFTCQEGHAVIVDDLGPNERPGCEDGYGAYVEQPTYQPWWAYEIPGDQVGQLLTAQITFLAVCWVGRVVYNRIAQDG